MFAIISAGAAPSLALLVYFYLRDRYEPEPIWIVIRSFILGGLLVFPIMEIQYAFQTEHVLQQPLPESFLLSGLLEEFSKWFIVIYSVYHHTEFNEHYDGIVYATAVSLGFASVENMFYLGAYGIHLAFIRALLPVSSHGLFGVVMGYYIGKAKFSNHKRRYLTIALFLTAFFHGLYDFIFKMESFWAYLVIPFMIFLWYYAYRKMELAQRRSDHYQHETF